MAKFKITIAIICVILLTDDACAVVNKGAEKSTEKVTEEPSDNVQEANDRIGNSYLPPPPGPNPGGIAPVYGPPSGTRYPPPPPDIPPPIPQGSYGPPRKPAPTYGLPSGPGWATYGPPKPRPPKPLPSRPKPTYGLPGIRPPKPTYLPTFNTFGPQKPGPGVPTSLETYGPPRPTPNLPFHSQQPQNQYLPPALDNSLPPRPPPPGVPAPPTPPDIKFDGWQPIAGVSNANIPNIQHQPNPEYAAPSNANGPTIGVPSDSYGVPIFNQDDQSLKSVVGSDSEINGLPPPQLPLVEPLHTDHGQIFTQALPSEGVAKFNSVGPNYGAPAGPSAPSNQYGIPQISFEQQLPTLLGPSGPSAGYVPFNEYGPPTQPQQPSQSPPSNQYAPPSNDYGAPPVSSAPPVPSTPSNQYGPPSTDYGAPPAPSPPSAPPAPSAPQLPPQQQYGEPVPPPQQQYGEPVPPPQQQYGGPVPPPQQQYGGPVPPPQQQYDEPVAPPQQQYGGPVAPPQQQYGEPVALPQVPQPPVPIPPQQQYGEPPQIQFGQPPVPPQQQYGEPIAPIPQFPNTYFPMNPPRFRPPNNNFRHKFREGPSGSSYSTMRFIGNPNVDFREMPRHLRLMLSPDPQVPLLNAPVEFRPAIPVSTGSLVTNDEGRASDNTAYTQGVDTLSAVPNMFEGPPISFNEYIPLPLSAQPTPNFPPLTLAIPQSLQPAGNFYANIGGAQGIPIFGSFAPTGNNCGFHNFQDANLPRFEESPQSASFLSHDFGQENLPPENSVIPLHDAPTLHHLDLQVDEQQKGELTNSYGEPLGGHFPGLNPPSAFDGNNFQAASSNALETITGSDGRLSSEELAAALKAQGYDAVSSVPSQELDAAQFLKTHEGNRALSIAQGSPAQDGIQIQGSKGTYSLVIQPADGSLGTENSDGSVKHENILKGGLLQDVIAVIEQPAGASNGQPHFDNVPQQPSDGYQEDLHSAGSSKVITATEFNAQAKKDVNSQTADAGGNRIDEEVSQKVEPEIALFINHNYKEPNGEGESAKSTVVTESADKSSTNKSH